MGSVLTMKVTGLRFRASDGVLSSVQMSNFVSQRLTNSGSGASGRLRVGDAPGDLQKFTLMRQPQTRNITPITDVAGLSAIKIPEMITIPAGKFMMGSSLDCSNEQPVRKVSLSRYALGKYPVTNAEYESFLRLTGKAIPALVNAPAKARHPVVNVSWNNAVEYCQWLSQQTDRPFRLPTEAEWEYAARGAQSLKYPFGNEWDLSKVVFNARGTESVDTHPEGASPFGIRHMSGNVWEWAADWYANTYNAEDKENPKGPKSGTSRVLRGGCWCSSDPDFLRSAYRGYSRPEFRYNSVGFRVAEDKK